MGRGSWSASDWGKYSKTHISGRTSARDIYAGKLKKQYDPSKFKFRESCDSPDHPLSTPIMIHLDVTGSMNRVVMNIAEKLGIVVEEILNRKPVTDPQILFGAIGDAMYDRAPLQVTQFESDIRIAKQLTELWFEQGGGGNNFESYPLAWWFAAHHTKLDSVSKRGKKGFLFTMGDDCFPDVLTREELEAVFGDTVQADITVEQVLQEANRKFEVFHLMIEEGGSSYMMRPDKWRDLMGERAISVRDYTKIPEIIVSLLEALSGKDTAEVVKSWDPGTGLVVQEALSGITSAKTGDLIEF